MEPLKVHRNDWRNLVALSLSALGSLYFFVQTISLSVLLTINILNSQINTDENILIGLLIWYSILSGLLLIPIFLLSFYDYREKPIPAWLDSRRPVIQKRLIWSILFLPAIIVVGWLIAGQPTLSVILLGLINVFVAGVPVLWICTVAQWQLDSGSQNRKWRIFGFSLTVMPIIVIFVEILAFLIMAGFGVAWITYQTSINPQLETELMFIINQISLNSGNPDRIFQLLEPYVLQPSVMFWAFAILCGVIPIIEEIIKPIALWALVGRKISPQEGFVGGLLCGAGFALMENLLYFRIVVTPEEWLFVSVGRIGTAVLHMLASGLVGWGFARAWRDGKWLHLVMMILGAFSLHGFWNAVALLSGVGQLMIGDHEMTLRQTVLFNLPLILLFLASLMSIFLINYTLRKGTKGQVAGTQICG